MKRIGLALLTGALLLCSCGNAAQESTEQTPQMTVPSEETTSPPIDSLQALLNRMTLEEKVGQLFLARCPEEGAVTDAAAYHLGGYILFGQDFDGETPESVRQTIASYQEAAKIPMFIAVDEEGGTVTRISRIPEFRFERFPSPRNLYAQGGLELVLALEAEKAIFLQDLGINVNMAPVCDVSTVPGAFMYARSLGESPETTGKFAAGTVSRMSEFGVGAVLKHFPGYGENADTHTGIARDSRSLQQLTEVDLVPFRAGISAGAEAILISHTIVEAMDASLPATLSQAVHAYLRETMGFDGVAVTDDLSMQAITDSFGAGESAVLAVLAGNDLLCSTEYPIQYRAVLEAAQDGRISAERLEEAVLRILRWKQSLGLLSA